MQQQETMDRERHHSDLPVLSSEGRARGESNAIVAGAAERKRAEIESALILAKRFPRREQDAFVRVMEMCDRSAFANGAVYSYPRGGQTVEGPSVALARQAERVWGNMQSGFEVLAMDGEYIHLRGYAIDLETNTTKSQEHRFRQRIQRKNKRTRETEWLEIQDERELRELIGRQGSILERNCILRLLPADLVEEAMDRSKATMLKAAKGDLTKSRREETIRGVVFAFRGLGVTAEMLEGRLGHPLDRVTEEEIVDLRKVHKALKDGQGKREEYFEVPGARRDGGPVRTDDLVERRPSKAKAEGSDDDAPGSGKTEKPKKAASKDKAEPEPEPEANEGSSATNPFAGFGKSDDEGAA